MLRLLTIGTRDAIDRTEPALVLAKHNRRKTGGVKNVFDQAQTHPIDGFRF
jgi:hypothetical protein